MDFFTSILIDCVSVRDSSFIPVEIPSDPSTAFPVFRLLDIGMRVSPERGGWASCPVCVTIEKERERVQLLRQDNNNKEELECNINNGTGLQKVKISKQHK